jgi:exodeoxyribonuclease-1
MPFIFYDFETTGLDATFDQALQFAAIHTDDDFNHLDEINIRCRRLPQIVPSPTALRITGVKPNDLEGANRSHYEMFCEIQTWCTQKGPCIYIGHNSINFDENFLRQGFYQNLHLPYLTNTNGNTRADVRTIAEGYFHHAPEHIAVPAGVGGRHIFKLGALARENGINFLEEDAHDALADVRATLDLASLLRSRSTDVWDSIIRHAQKGNVSEFLKENDFFYASFFFLGRPYSYLMTKVASNSDDLHDIGLFDLTVDPNPYLAMSVDELIDVLNASPKIIRTIRINRFPLLMNKNLPSQYLKGDHPSEEDISTRISLIKENDAFQLRLSEALSQRYGPREPSDHVEEQIYDGFYTHPDKQRIQRFHNTSWDQRHPICNEFEDIRLRNLGIRLIYNFDPQLIPEDDRRQHQGWINHRITAQDASWLTIEKALIELDELARKNEDERDEFDNLRRYFKNLDQAPSS